MRGDAASGVQRHAWGRFLGAKLIAPSIGVFAQCVGELQGFAAGRSGLVELDANPPTPEQQAQFLRVIRSLTNGDQDTLVFWAVQIELDLDAFDWSE